MVEPIGCDYGVKPRVLAVGDIDFVAPLQRSFQALGYSVAEGPGQMIAEPLLMMIFSNELDAQIAFNHFKRWSDNSGSGDAVAINFIEHDNGEYSVSIGPEMDRLITRCFGANFRDEVDPIVQVAYFSKTFPAQSRYYHAFKAIAQGGAFQLLPATNMGYMPEWTITKQEVSFYDEHTAHRSGMLSIDHSGEPLTEPEGPPAPPPPEPADVDKRRREQLDRFYPVTLTRLRREKVYEAARETLKAEGFAEWQVTQAACNISLRYRAPQLLSPDRSEVSEDRSGSAPGKIEVLEYLVSHYEEANLRLPPAEALTAHTLAAQIAADSRDLLDHFPTIDTQSLQPAELQRVLLEQGLVVRE
ncbi:MAG TPA: hypothetical protein VEX13_14665 [Chloroflexia bacterium]|nr:hypothetical protein [Chloroflexia bacterium]